MRTIQGVSVSAGIAIGTVRVLAAVDYAVERRLIDDPQAEMDRFRAARDTAVAQLKQLRDNVAAEFGENKAELFDAHRLMLQDPDYAECVEGLIAQDKVNAEFAVKSAAEQFAAMFAAMDSSTMQARAADVKDVSRRVMNVLQGKRDSTAQDGSVQGDAVQNGIVQNGIAQNGESHIIFAEDLAPSDTAQLDRAKVLGLVTAKGSANSHTAILARTMGLPAITGIGDAFDPADDGHVAVIDGTSGAVFVDPDEATLTEYRRRKAEAEEHLSLLRKLKGKPTETKSGQRVHLYANISRPSDAAAVLANFYELDCITFFCFFRNLCCSCIWNARTGRPRNFSSMHTDKSHRRWATVRSSSVRSTSARTNRSTTLIWATRIIPRLVTGQSASA